MTGQKKAHQVEVDAAGLIWIKSSASTNDGTGCVEAAGIVGGVIVRCSRDRSGPQLSHSWLAWHGLLRWIKAHG